MMRRKALPWSRGNVGSLLPLLLAATTASSCATIARRYARAVAETSIERELTFYRENTSRFLACVDQRGGVCPAREGPAAAVAVEPLDTRMPVPAIEAPSRPEVLGVAAAGMAREVLNHSVQTQINDFYNYLRGVEGDRLSPSFRAPRPELRLNVADLDDYLLDVEAATVIGGWDALAAETGVSPASADGRRRAFIQAYFREYFRNGEFFEFSLTPAGLVDRVKAQLEAKFPLLDESQIGKLVDTVLKEYLNLEKGADGAYPQVPLFGSLATGGFVTRGGKGYQFPNVAAQFDPTADRKVTVTAVDFVVVGSDLIRVLLHAIFDAHDGLPAVSNATGATLGDHALPVNVPGSDGHLSAENFGEVEVFAERVEGLTSTAIGRVIRGVSWIALNNEALATLIETTVGVAARKFSEKAAWCWYSCGLARGPRDVVLATAERVPVRVVVSGPRDLLDSMEPWEPK